MALRKHKLLAIVVSAATTALMIGFTPGVALANHSGVAAGQVGGFEIDGNFLTDANPGTFDWDTVGSQSNVDGPIRVNDAFDSQSDDVFGGGSKEQEPDGWTFGSGPKPPGKDDLTRIYYASRIDGGIAYLWLGFERLDVQGVGDAHVNFELNRSTATVVNGEGETIPARTADDLLVVYDYSGGSGPVNVEVRSWSGTSLAGSWGAPVGLPAGSVFADINSGSVTRPNPPGSFPADPFEGGTVDDRRFGEVGLNLTAIFGGSVPSCPGFAQFWAKSRSSGESFNSALKDTIDPVGIDLSTCPDLHITKTSSSAIVNAGGSYHYTLTATNDGVAAATNVIVTDNLDDDLIITSATFDNNPGLAGGTGNCSVNHTTNAVSCNVGTLAASDGNTTGSEPDTAVVTINVTAPQEACGTVVNTAHVASSDEPDNQDDDNASDPVTVTVQCPAIHITKTADASPVSAGSQIGFTINVWNSGPGTATNVHVTDTLPNDPGLSWSLSPAVAGCTLVGFSLDCTFASMAPGTATTNNKSIHVISGTTAESCGTVSNTARVETDNDGSASAGASITVQCPDVKVVKTADEDPISAGDTARFTIVVSNLGPGTATDVTLSDTLPAGIAWAEDSSDCTISGQSLSCDFGDLASGASRTIHVSGVTDAADCGLLTNTAIVAASNESSGALGNNSSTDTLSVLCGEVSVSKSADSGTVSAGEDIGFLITVINGGSGRADDVTLTDTLPTNAGLSWTIDGGTGQGSCAILSGVLTCTFGSLEPGESRTVHISSPTTAATCGVVRNIASVTTSNDGDDTTPEVTITVQCPDVKVVKTADEDPISAGDTARFTIVVSNLGPGTATDVTLSDTLPAGIVWAEDSSDCTISGQSLSCDFGDLASGASRTIHVSGVTDAADCGLLTNTAIVAASNEPSGALGNNSSTDTLDVLCADVHITKAPDAGSVNAGSAIGFLITVSNDGDGRADDVTVTDGLPTAGGLLWSIDGGTASEGECSITGTTLTCHFGSMAPGASETVHISAATTVLSCSTISNTAEVTTTNDGSNEATGRTTVVCPDVDIEKTPAPTTVHVGETITYTLVVTNDGDVNLQDVVVADPRCDSAPAFAGGDTGSDGILGLTETWTYTCTHVVVAADGDPILNTATVTALSVVLGGNREVSDEDSASVDVVHPAIQIVKTVDPTGGNPGQVVTYTYVVTNTGDTPLVDVSVDDDKLGHIGDIDRLEVGASATLTKDATLNAVGDIVNVATATGDDEFGATVTDTDDASVSIVLAKRLVRTGSEIRILFGAGVVFIFLGAAMVFIPVRRRRGAD